MTTSEFLVTVLATLAVTIDKIPAVGAVLSTQDVLMLLLIPAIYVCQRFWLKNKAMSVAQAVTEALADAQKALPQPPQT